MPRNINVAYKETDGLPEVRWVQTEIVPDNTKPNTNPRWVALNKYLNVNTKMNGFIDPAYRGLARRDFRASVSIEFGPDDRPYLFSLPRSSYAAKLESKDDQHEMVLMDDVQGFVMDSGQKWSSPKMPPFDVILVDIRGGRAKIIAEHYGNPVAMAELRAVLHETFLSKRPATGWVENLHPALYKSAPPAPQIPPRPARLTRDDDDVI